MNYPQSRFREVKLPSCNKIDRVVTARRGLKSSALSLTDSFCGLKFWGYMACIKEEDISTFEFHCFQMRAVTTHVISLFQNVKASGFVLANQVVVQDQELEQESVGMPCSDMNNQRDSLV